MVYRAPLETVLFREGGVSRVRKSSCIRPYTPVFRARLPCPTKNAWFLEVPYIVLSSVAADLTRLRAWAVKRSGAKTRSRSQPSCYFGERGSAEPGAVSG